jgi:competence protein ComEC
MLDRPAYDAVRGLGIAHLLALSGMHLTMIAALAVLATRWTPRRRDTIVALALSLYVGVVGNVDSLTRAWLMALLILAARALVRPPRPIDSLGKALLLMLLCAPHAVLSVGLQLSFVATFAVLVCLERMPASLLRSPRATDPAWRRAWARCAQGATIAFVVSLVVEVFIAPLQLHHFGQISVVGPLATVVFLVPVTVLQGMALAASFGLPVVGVPSAASLAWAASATRDAIVFAGTTAPQPLALPEPHWAWYYAAVFVVCAQPRRALAWAMAAVGIALSFICGPG